MATAISEVLAAIYEPDSTDDAPMALPTAGCTCCGTCCDDFNASPPSFCVTVTRVRMYQISDDFLAGEWNGTSNSQLPADSGTTKGPFASDAPAFMWTWSATELCINEVAHIVLHIRLDDGGILTFDNFFIDFAGTLPCDLSNTAGSYTYTSPGFTFYYTVVDFTISPGSC